MVKVNIQTAQKVSSDLFVIISSSVTLAVAAKRPRWSGCRPPGSGWAGLGGRQGAWPPSQKPALRSFTSHASLSDLLLFLLRAKRGRLTSVNTGEPRRPGLPHQPVPLWVGGLVLSVMTPGFQKPCVVPL